MRDLFTRRRPGDLTRAAFAGLPRRRSLVASAAVLTAADGKSLTRRRRDWQTASFRFRVALPEVGYVHRWLGNNSAHIRLTVGDRPPGVDEVAELDDEYGWTVDDNGAPVREPDALPDDLVDAARAALSRLTGDAPSGGGAAILAPIVTHFEGPGECYLVGRYTPETDREAWAVHSISEVRYDDGRYPGAPSDTPRGYWKLVTGEGRQAEALDLDPATSTVVRLWRGDAEWSAEPDSPMRSLVGVCEQLLMIEKGRMAVLRSRAAGNGVLLMPEELSALPHPDDDTDDDEDPFDRDFVTQLTTPLAIDGSAAQVVPQVYRGAYAYLDRIRLLTFERSLDPRVAEEEARLLARVGIGLDVSPEVITGLSDVNHWNAWQISSDSFKHHQEPITIDAVEALTAGYLRYRLRLAQRWTDDLIDRVVLWYDASNLVAPADMRATANDALDRGQITGEGYRALIGIGEEWAPEEQQTADAPIGSTGMTADVLLAVSNIAGNLLRGGYVPEAVSEALGLNIAHTGLVPVTVKPNEADAGPPALPPGGGGSPPQGEPPGSAPNEGQPPEGTPPASAAIIAAAAPTAEQRRLSRRLAHIEQQLRDRIATAAAAAITRALERAGNRVRAVGQRDDTVREAATGLPGERITAAVGRTLVAALGLDEQQLLAEAFTRLREQYTEWTEAAAGDAIDTAVRLAGLDPRDPDVQRTIGELRDRFFDTIGESWPTLERALTDLAGDRLYEPDPTAPPVGELPATIVPPGVVREALRIAGGIVADDDGRPPLPGLTSGELLGRFIRDAGCQPTEYEWAYGISARPFPPHLALDGQVFAGFDDPVLGTAGTGHEWVGGSFVPGDHLGCHCDYAVIYATGNTRDELEAIGRASYLEQKGRPAPTRGATVDPDVFLDPARPRPALRR